MTIVLGIDTATSGCAAALIRNADCLAEAAMRMTRGQSEALAPMIDDVIRRGGIAFADIDAIAVTRGPGAFTGLRIGLAAARAMALAISRPCLGINTFEVLFTQVRKTGVLGDADAVLVAVDSKREEQFIAVFDPSGMPLGEPAAMRPQEARRHLGNARRVCIVGDGADKVAPGLDNDFDVIRPPGIEVPDPVVVAELGLNFLGSNKTSPATPLYLRPPDVSVPNT